MAANRDRSGSRTDWHGDLPWGAGASVNTKPISSLIKLWQRLDCYGGSLRARVSTRYCEEKPTLFSSLVGCDHHLCLVRCQFICTPCMSMEREATTAIPTNRFDISSNPVMRNLTSG